jgi:hypothetical protein
MKSLVSGSVREALNRSAAPQEPRVTRPNFSKAGGILALPRLYLVVAQLGRLMQ